MERPVDVTDDGSRAADPLPLPPAPAVAPAPTPPARPCRITFHGCVASEAPRVEVRAWLARLGALTGPMLDGDVVIEALDEARTERRYRVRIQLQMPAGPVSIGSDHPANLPSDDVYVAIRNGFRAARRELELQQRAQAPEAL